MKLETPTRPDAANGSTGRAYLTAIVVAVCLLASALLVDFAAVVGDGDGAGAPAREGALDSGPDYAGAAL